MSRSGNTCKIFLDGVEKGSATFTNSITTGNPNEIASSPTYGYKNLYMDELRISRIARYTSGFTAPTAEFVNDSNTVLLVHFNGTNGSTTFTDDNSL